ncbi:MAG: steroid delta-isomerase, partial [Bacteroidota bacterium]
MSRFIFFFFASFTFYFSYCQAPETDIFLFELEITDDSIILNEPTNISANEGYDNQPSFTRDSQSVLYARTINDQTDIANYSIASGKTKLVSNTTFGSEYSPLQMPKSSSISSIRLDTSGLQRLYQYSQVGEHEILVEDFKIGYHVWINQNRLAAFVLGDPPTLQVFDLENRSNETIATNIGRALHYTPGSNSISFVDKSALPWKIMLHDLATNSKRYLTNSLENTEDFCWLDSKQLLMGQDSILWIWEESDGWKKVADLSHFGINNITRLAVSPNQKFLALV